MEKSNLTILAKRKIYSILCKKKGGNFAGYEVMKELKLPKYCFYEKNLSLSVGCKEKNPDKCILIQFLFLAVGPHL